VLTLYNIGSKTKQLSTKHSTSYRKQR